MRLGRGPDLRLVVAMSGGVDSSVAAALLAEQGHEVIGVSMQLYDHGRRDARLRHLLHARRPARRAARGGAPRHPALHPQLRVALRRRTCSLELRARVRRGPHADPLRALQQRAEVRDAARARAGAWTPRRSPPATTPGSIADDDGRFHLLRGRDPGKDQSYFLFSLTQAQMAQARFPVGELDKDDGAGPRAPARPARRRQARQPGDLLRARRRLRARSSSARRPALATRGRDRRSSTARVLGTHEGVHRFTIGQRKGLGSRRPQPLYVVDIDAERRRA